jgi:hypothetical protein
MRVNPMPEIIASAKVVGPRLIGLAAATIVSYLHIRVRDFSTLTAGDVLQMLTLFGTTHTLVHRAVSAYFNPGDSARPKLVDAEQRAVTSDTVVKVEK